ncbi:MAG: metal ABC transporter ATP-binding protein [Elusimicrobia bacterium]|nr:metal ABC transporter ATP-binding protein [Elusimicrobiota bacterium]
MKDLLVFENADLGYRGSPILRGLSLSFQEGEAVGMVGPNGCGKTTFLRSALGLLKPLQGRVDRRPDRRFSYVPQAEELNLLWPQTIRETVELPLRSRRLFGRLIPEERAAVEKAMERTGVASIADRLLREGSGGQRQRAIIAQAVAQSPDVILLDEPTKGLDVVAERDLMGLIEDLARSGLTVFLVSHTLHLPLNFCQRILLFHSGRVIDTTPKEIVETNRLETVYGVPFVHMERDGQRFVMPARGTR